MKFQSSGYLIVQVMDSILQDYCGVDRTIWLLGDEKSDLCWLENEQDNAGERDCVLGNLQQAESYLRRCKNEGINVRHLYCKCTAKGKCIPVPQNISLTFCGLDYAYPSGDYYSSVLNEVIAGTSTFAMRWKPRLNPYGLISSEADMNTFIKERAAYAQEYGCDSVVLEKGFFAAFEVYLCAPKP